MTTQLDITGCTVDIVHNLIDNGNHDIIIVYTKDNVSYSILYCTIWPSHIEKQFVNDYDSIDDYIKHVNDYIKAISNEYGQATDKTFDTTIDIYMGTWTHYGIENSWYEIEMDEHNGRALFTQLYRKLITIMKDIFKS